MMVRVPDRHVLLLRHAERPELPEGTVGHDVSLTDAGRAASRALGETIGGRLAVLVSSPVARCVETAQGIGVGSGVRCHVESSALLGDPGAFVIQPEVAWAAWVELGHAEMMVRLMAGRVDRPGFRDRDEGAALVARLVRETLARLGDGEVGVLVTHDAVLGPVASAWFPEFEPSVPAFLEGAVCWADGDQLRVAWRGEVRLVGVR
jgi:broad specificity phosphatase PhoE